MKFSILLTSSAALSVLMSSFSYGQEGDPVVVTGTIANETANQVSAFKTGTPLVDIPQSLSVYTKEQLKEQGIQSLADIADYTPGINTSQGEGHRDAIVFRGVRSTADFFLDGVRDDMQYYRPLYNVEKVEVLRGPNSLNFGRGGTGGVINRVMKKAEVGENFHQIEGSIDTFGEIRTAYDTNYTLSDQAALRLNLHYDSLENHRDYYYGDQYGVNPTFTYEFNEDTRVRFSYEYNDHERYIDRGIPTNESGNPVESLKGVTFGDATENYSTFEAHVLKATLEHQFSEGWKASATASYGTYDKLYQNLYASDYISSTNAVELDGYKDTTQRDRFQLSGDLIGEFETGTLEHKFLVGGELIHTSNDNDRFNTVWVSSGNDKAFVGDASTFSVSGGVLRTGTDSYAYSDLNDRTELTLDAYSFYLQDEIAVNDSFDVILGARFDHIEQEFRNLATSGAKISKSDSRLSPRLGFVYKPLEALSLYASYSESFIPTNGGQYASVSDQLDPDVHVNLETGVKYNFNENFTTAASVFKITTTVQSDTAGVITETDTEIHGAEVELKGKLTDRWYLSAGYSYLDAEGHIREIPRHSFSLWTSYQVTEKFGAGIGVVYQDESLVTNSSSSAVLPSYTRVDLAAHYNFSENYRLSFNIENLFDTTYYPNSHSTHQVSVGAPINARLGFTAKF